MSTIPTLQFIRTLPEAVLPHLPAHLRQSVQPRQPFRWVMQFHFGEPRLHYELARVRGKRGWEIGLHCEAKDKRLNRFLLDGFRRNLFEIKATLGEQVEAEMWDRGWTKIYEVVEERPLTGEYQAEIGQRMAAHMVCIHPIFVDLRRAVSQIHR